MKRFVAAAMAMAALIQPAFSYDSCVVPEGFGLSANDASRLENLDTSRTRGLGGALRGFVADEQAVVAELFEPGTAPVDPELLAGAYQCRTIKLGGNLPLVVYGWFKCDISQDADGFKIRKLTGSQNFAGVLVPAGSGFAYKGASFYGYEGPGRVYGDAAEHDQVGCLSAVTKGNRHFILELPFPPVESFHDVIEFKPEKN